MATKKAENKSTDTTSAAGREFRAEARFQRTSPQKAKLVLDMIKGQRVELALNILMFARKRIAPVVEKALRSAVQNAAYLSQEQGFDLDVDNLVVKSAVANEGPRMKRIRPAPMGRAFRYQRRMAHIIVTVGERTSKATAAKSTGDASGTPKKQAAQKPGTKKQGSGTKAAGKV